MQNSNVTVAAHQADQADGAVDVNDLLSGYTVLEQAEPEVPTDFSSLRIELVPFLDDGETYISGETMVVRAKSSGANFGGRLAKILSENQGPLETTWRRYLIIFTGLIVVDTRGDKRVLGMSWNGVRWQLHLRWLERSFGHHTRLIRVL